MQNVCFFKPRNLGLICKTIYTTIRHGGSTLKPKSKPFPADLTRMGLSRNANETIVQKAILLKLFISATFRQSELLGEPLKC